MIMMMNKKKTLDQIMGDPEGTKETSPLETIMQEFMQCLDNNDAAGAAECFKSAFAHCGTPETPQE